MRPWIQGVLACGALALGLLGARVLISTRPTPEPKERIPFVPGVRVHVAKEQDFVPTLRARGEVRPAEVVSLVSEVSGKIDWVADEFVQGGFVRLGQELWRLDSKDFALAVVEAQAAVDEAMSRLVSEEAQAKSSLSAWDGPHDTAPPLVRREPQLTAARAALASAKASLARRQRDVERCVARAPYDAWVRQESVSHGQWAAAGSSLAVLADAGRAEVRFSVPQRDLQWIAHQPGARIPPGEAPEVLLEADFAGARRAWSGRLDRVEPELDTQTRMAWLVAALEDPYGRSQRSSGDDGPRAEAVSMPAGLFVEASLFGQKMSAVFVLPREAEREANQLYIASAEGRLCLREVQVARREREWIVIRSGLSHGEQVILSKLATPIDGMRIQVLTDDPKGAQQGRE